jgi:ADP-ribose pyrophosphatase
VCASWMTAPRVENPAVEPGIEMNLATPKELMALILAEEFVLQLHVGALLLAGMRGYVDLASFR